MATRLIGTDSTNPRLPDAVILATQGPFEDDLAPGNMPAQKAAEALDDANAYTDSKLIEANAYTDEQIAHAVIDPADFILADEAETIAGTVDTKAVTPLGLAYERPYLDVRSYGAEGDGTTNDQAACQAALTAANALLGVDSTPGATVVFPPGVYNLGSTGLTARCSIEMLPGASLLYSGTGICLLVDTVNEAVVTAKVIRTAIDWDDDTETTSVGVSFRNCNFARAKLWVLNFAVGVQHHGDEDGSSYSITDLVECSENKVGLLFKKTGVGWANQHEIHGRIRLGSLSAAGVAGSRYIDLTQSGNGSTFMTMSLEGARCEYCVDCSVPYVVFLNCRWEATAPFRINTSGNAHLVGGYSNLGHNATSGLQFVNNGGTITTIGYLGSELQFDGGGAGTGRGLELQAINAPANIVLSTKAATTAKTYSELQANGTLTLYRSGKGDATFPAADIVLDPINRKIFMGDGSAAPVNYILGTSQTRMDFGPSTGFFRTLGNFEANGTIPITIGNAGARLHSGNGAPAVAAPVGSLYMRLDGGATSTLYVKESGTGTTGWVAK